MLDYDQAICCERAVVERSAGLFQEAIAKVMPYRNCSDVSNEYCRESCRILAGDLEYGTHSRICQDYCGKARNRSAPLILEIAWFWKCMRESIGERKCSAKPECGESDTGAVSFQGGFNS